MVGFGSYRNEIPKVVVGSLSLGYFIMRHRLARVNDVGEFNGVLNEKDGNVVADQIEVALGSIELGGKPTNISDGIRRPY